MGMAIADNIDFLNDAKKLFEDIANNPGINETVKTHFTIESLESAIDIMRKYKKINDIVNDYYNSNKYEDYMDGEIIEIIKFVLNDVYEVENGNDN